MEEKRRKGVGEKEKNEEKPGVTNKGTTQKMTVKVVSHK